ncbi:hypothetical protein KL86APRO_30069 [uncultured Alphaproteobacteria bacterium]|uniref:Oxaloacetate decarboxylase, gamma chain n=1 Tax=uncultured Alphaproteobacteria bacterium TaxID=91750 RepID=A0A212KLH0_9PROT|nr:hypothetical protein KL86APRO_30069 [uncultured Alphaproteobacteria bacterium]
MSVIMDTTQVVAQVAQATAETDTLGLAPWEGGLFGFIIVMTALIGIWAATSLVGTYFAKSEKSSKKAEAAPQAAPAASAAKPVAAAPAEEIPLAVIIAAAAHAVGGQVRNVIVHVPGRESVSWTSQGRQSIYASHGTKSPQAVSSLGTIKK